MKRIAIFLSLMALAVMMGGCTKGCKQEPKTPPVEEKTPEDKPTEGKTSDASDQESKKAVGDLMNLKTGEKLYAEFDTNMGTIKAELFWEKAPMTVRNFVELVMGKKEW